MTKFSMGGVSLSNRTSNEQNNIKTSEEQSVSRPSSALIIFLIVLALISSFAVAMLSTMICKEINFEYIHAEPPTKMVQPQSDVTESPIDEADAPPDEPIVDDPVVDDPIVDLPEYNFGEAVPESEAVDVSYFNEAFREVYNAAMN